jgi:outer membrane protein TolC
MPWWAWRVRLTVSFAIVSRVQSLWTSREYAGLISHHFYSRWPVLLATSLLPLSGCASLRKPEPTRAFPPQPEYPPDHAYSLDELVQLSVFRNASLDVSRYEAEAAQGLVDQVKALWLPALRYDLAATGYDNDLNYRVRAYHLATINVPLTGTYNITNSLALSQIISTGGKRTSGLKQAKMFAAIKKLDVLRQQDAVAQDVATYYQLVCLTSDIDGVLEDAVRRIRVIRQVAEHLGIGGSLRANRLDFLEADFLTTQIEQLQIAVRAGRQQAYAALKQSVGLNPDEPLLLTGTSLPPALTGQDVLRVSSSIVKGFLQRPENAQVDLFTRIREEQVKSAKAAWAPNFVFLGNAVNVAGSNNTIFGAVDGLIASLVIDVPVYDPARRGKLREALGFEQASLAFQHQVEQLLTLEIEVTALDAQKALATVLEATRAMSLAEAHLDTARQAYSRELIPASGVVIAIGFDAFAKINYRTTLFNYHNARARLKRVTVDREAQYGY